jgi:hypothetical protein
MKPRLAGTAVRGGGVYKRDQISLIRNASRLQQVDLKLVDVNCDVFGLADGGRACCLAVLHFREGLLMSTDHYVFNRTLWDLSRTPWTATPSSFSIISMKTGTCRRTLLLPGDAGFRSRGHTGVVRNCAG